MKAAGAALGSSHFQPCDVRISGRSWRPRSRLSTLSPRCHVYAGAFFLSDWNGTGTVEVLVPENTPNSYFPSPVLMTPVQCLEHLTLDAALGLLVNGDIESVLFSFLFHRQKYTGLAKIQVSEFIFPFTFRRQLNSYCIVIFRHSL